MRWKISIAGGWLGYGLQRCGCDNLLFSMRMGKKSLRMSSGKVRHFRSEQALKNFERVAMAVKHGFKPTGKRTKKRRKSRKYAA